MDSFAKARPEEEVRVEKGGMLKNEEEFDMSLAELNPTVNRLTNELKDEKQVGRVLKKKWRLAQADHQIAAAEADRLLKENEILKKSYDISNRISGEMEAELKIKQAQFTESDVRAAFLNKDLVVSKMKLETEIGVVNKYTGDLVDVRRLYETELARRKELEEENKQFKKENVALTMRLAVADAEVRKVQNDMGRVRIAEADARAAGLEAGRRVSNQTKELTSQEKKLEDITAYAHRMREECYVVTEKLKEEKAVTKDLTAKLEAKTKEWWKERDLSKANAQEAAQERNTVLGLRKDKSAAESVAIAVQRDKNEYFKGMQTNEAEVVLLKANINERVADIESLRAFVKKLEGEIARLEVELRKSKEQASTLRKERDAMTQNWKAEVEETKRVKKDAQNERNTTVVTCKELSTTMRDLKKSDIHGRECDDVIGRLTAQIEAEHNRLLKSQEIVKELNEKLRKSEAMCRRTDEKLDNAESTCKNLTQELNTTKTMAANNGILVSKLGVDARDARLNHRTSEGEVTRLETTLETFRQNLIAREAEVKERDAKIVELRKDVTALNLKMAVADTKKKEAEKNYQVVEEKLNMSQKQVQGERKAAEALGRDLHIARKQHAVTKDELGPTVDSNAYYVKAIHELEAKLKATEPVIADLKKEVVTERRRAERAEATEKSHSKIVADLEEQTELARNHDNTSTVATNRIAERLYAVQKKIPPLEQEVAVYKGHVERMNGEIIDWEKKLKASEQVSRKLAAELDISKKEVVTWKEKVPPLEKQLADQIETLCYTQDKCKDDDTIKVQMATELKQKRRQAADAEQRCEVLTEHIERLIEQLKLAGTSMGSSGTGKPSKEARKLIKQVSKSSKLEPLSPGLSSMKSSSSLTSFTASQR